MLDTQASSVPRPRPLRRDRGAHRRRDQRRERHPDFRGQEGDWTVAPRVSPAGLATSPLRACRSSLGLVPVPPRGLRAAAPTRAPGGGRARGRLAIASAWSPRRRWPAPARRQQPCTHLPDPRQHRLRAVRRRLHRRTLPLATTCRRSPAPVAGPGAGPRLRCPAAARRLGPTCCGSTSRTRGALPPRTVRDVRRRRGAADHRRHLGARPTCRARGAARRGRRAIRRRHVEAIRSLDRRARGGAAVLAPAATRSRAGPAIIAAAR